MLTIKPNKRVPYQGSFKSVSDHVVSVSGNAGTDGFKVYRDEECTFLLGRYDEFVTVYRQLEDETQYSDDGSIYVPPTPPTPPEPTHSKLVIGGNEYDAIDFTYGQDMSWKMVGDAATITAMLTDCTSFKVNDVEYDNLVYRYSYQDGEYVICGMHQKTELELELEGLHDTDDEIRLYNEEQDDALIELDESTTENQQDVEDALAELYDMVAALQA